MRKFSILFFAFVLSVNSVFAAPLVFKVTKEVAAGGEIARFETSKYKKILVGAMFVSDNIKIKEDRDDRDIKIFAVEDNDLFYILSMGIYKAFSNRAVPIENLPSKISFIAEKAGTYKIYIWAE